MYDVATTVARSALMEGDFNLIDGMLQKWYWSRIWIIREIGLAQGSNIIYEADSIQWKEPRGWVTEELAWYVLNERRQCLRRRRRATT